MNGHGHAGGTSAADPKNQAQYAESYTDAQLKQAWNAFAEKRKIYQAEYHLLTQPFDRNNHQLIIHLHNPVQETLLDNVKSDLTAFLRDTLKNSLITVVGELREETDERKVLYTDKEKLEYLLKKNPALKELKDRLELDTDY